jgi:hypothetical protein
MDPSIPNESAEEPADELQFDRADFGEAAAAGTQRCAIRGETITGTYYEINGTVACEACHAQAVALRTGGSGFGRFARATVFGILAGAVGAGIYYGISALTGYNIGLVAILVGFLVGFAVSYGAQQRGGWLYQLLAVGLTYCAIVATYVPEAAEQLRLMQEQEMLAAGAAEPAGADDGTEPPTPTGLFEAEELEAAGLEEEVAAEPSESAAAEDALEEAPPAGLAEDELASEATVVVTWALAIVFAFFAPVFMGFDGNVIGILIIAFGLWEAWRINRKQPFEVSGPYQVAGAGP